jgi:hypothetical protein
MGVGFMRTLVWVLTGGLLSVVCLMAVVWFMPQPSFTHDAPRSLPWTLPDYKPAKTHYRTLDDGRLEITIEHLPLPGVSPAMLAWFYKVLPISRVQLDGSSYPLYHLFHPTEHGVIQVSEPAANGVEGMGVGALVTRQEWFGPYNSVGSGRILSFSSAGMTVAPEVAGMSVGFMEHRFEATPCGSRYTLRSVLGSKLPVVGNLINLYIRHRQFPPEKVQQWLRHQVQEVSSLPFFLPELYRQRTPLSAAMEYVLNAGSINQDPGCGLVSE